MSISLKDARVAIDAALLSAAAMQINVAVCVVDARGDEIALARMDGARFFTSHMARGKAMTSATFGHPSVEIMERGGSLVYQAISQLQQGRLVFAQGAVPITRDNQVIGAIGVGGGTAQQDEEVAISGLKALQ